MNIGFGKKFGWSTFKKLVSGEWLPPLDGLLQWLKNITNTGLPEDAVDPQVIMSPTYVNVATLCTETGGTIYGDFLSTDTISHNGTASVDSVLDGQVTFGIGTVSQIAVNGDVKYPCAEAGSFTLYNADSVASPNGTFFMDEFYWLGNDDGVPSWNVQKGCSVEDIIEPAFITTWETIADSESITIPTDDTSAYNGTIDWGDGSAPLAFTTYDDVNLTHVYATAGKYRVKILGTFERMYSTDTTSLDRIISVDNLGRTGMTSLDRFCHQAENLVNFNSGDCDLSLVDSMYYMTYGAKKLKYINMKGANTSSVINMISAFDAANNIPDAHTSLIMLDDLNTSNNTSLNFMFRGRIFDNPANLNGWDVSSVQDADGMFTGTTGEVNLRNWIFGPNTNLYRIGYTSTSYYSRCTKVDTTGWDTRLATSMHSIFYYWKYLEEIVGADTWDTSNITNMSSLFSVCDELLTVDCSTWNVEELTTAAFMFSSSFNISTLDVSAWNPVKLQDASFMFRGVGAVELDVSAWNTPALTNTISMFDGCDKLLELDLSNWDVSNVSTMQNMFDECRSMTNISLDNWNTISATNMSALFYNCNALSSIDVTSFDTSNVTNMSYMFSSCIDLASLDISGFNVSKVTSMQNMFNNMQSITVLDFSTWTTLALTNMDSMFIGNTLMTTLDLTYFDVSNVTIMDDMLRSCTSLVTVDMSGWDVSNLSSVDFMLSSISANIDASNWTFSSTTNLRGWGGINGSLTYMSDVQSINITGWDTSMVTHGEYMFAGFRSLATLDTSILNTSSMTSMSAMFRSCNNLATIDATGFNTSNVTSMDSMFSSCTDLTGINVSNFDTSNVTSMYLMFSSCTSVTTLDLSTFDVSNVTKMESMFSGNTSMLTLDVSTWVCTSLLDSGNMFANCKLLSTLDLSTWGMANVTIMSQMFYNCNGLISVNTTGWNTSNVTTTTSMFFGCHSLTSTGASDWDTSKVTTMSHMFRDCRALLSLDVSGWDTSKVITMSYMFQDCLALLNMDLSAWDTSLLANMSYMFQNCLALQTLNMDTCDVTNVTTYTYFLRYCTLTTTSYSDLLVDFAAQTVSLNEAFHGGYSKYNAAGEIARNTLETTYNWTITDGGLEV